MEQVYEEELVEVRKPIGIAKSVLSWTRSNLKFLFLPGYRLEELTTRQEEHEKTISKRKFIRRLKSTLTIIGISIIFIIVSFAVHAPWIANYSYPIADGVWEPWYAPPSAAHPLGTTHFGRDVLARMIWGARSSLTIALPAITLSVTVGVFFGIIAAYYGGWVDAVIMRIADILFAFPGLIFAIVLVGILGRRMQYIILAYGILGIPYYARLIRGSVLQARELPYVEAAKVAGAGKWRIMFRHIMPNTIQPIIISFTFDIGGVILSFAGLAFLGYSDPHLIEWGRDIDLGRGHLVDAPWASFWPGMMIVFTVLGFMLVGDGLRDALDPRLRNL
jgi:peptide/nickel transport system permease protein